MNLTLWVAGFIALLAALLFWQSARQRRASGLPGGRVIYSDTRAWGRVEKPLYDAATGLAGKPDYLVAQPNGVVIPVEVKTGHTPVEPYDTHIYQLAAYCYLVEHEIGIRPPYGILHYPERTYAVDYTRELEQSLLDVLAEMRACDRRAEVGCSHDQPGRCVRCGYRSICDQKAD